MNLEIECLSFSSKCGCISKTFATCWFLHAIHRRCVRHCHRRRRCRRRHHHNCVCHYAMATGSFGLPGAHVSNTHRCLPARIFGNNSLRSSVHGFDTNLGFPARMCVPEIVASQHTCGYGKSWLPAFMGVLRIFASQHTWV